MTNIISSMLFDTEMIDKLKQTGISNELLYNQLISGKITMKEYLALSK